MTKAPSEMTFQEVHDLLVPAVLDIIRPVLSTGADKDAVAEALRTVASVLDEAEQ